MVFPWIYYRLWFFILHVIRRIFEEIYYSEHPVVANTFNITVGFLIALSFMHIFWFYLMIKGLLKKLGNMNGVTVGGSANV